MKHLAENVICHTFKLQEQKRKIKRMVSLGSRFILSRTEIIVVVSLLLILQLFSLTKGTRKLIAAYF